MADNNPQPLTSRPLSDYTPIDPDAVLEQWDKKANEVTGKYKEAERERLNLERAERIEALPPLRRFLRRNWIAVSAAVLVFIVAPLATASWFGYQAFERNQLLASCDWSNVEKVIRYDNWVSSWLQCDDPEIRARVLQSAPEGALKETEIAWVLRRMTPEEARVLLRRRDLADESYAQVASSSDSEARTFIEEDVLKQPKEYPVAALMQILQWSDEDFQLNIASSPGLPGEALEYLAELVNPSVTRVLYQNLEIDWSYFPPCSEGGPCRAGDEGPAGGTIFWSSDESVYAEDRGNRPGPVYLESARDILDAVIWCPRSDRSFVAPVYPSTPTNSALGSGAGNTRIIVDSCGEATAAGSAAGYRGGGVSDWFLPSLGELEKLRDRWTDVFGWPLDDNIWSSSQESATDAYFLRGRVGAPRMSSRAKGGQTTSQPKVAPIRSFSPLWAVSTGEPVQGFTIR